MRIAFIWYFDKAGEVYSMWRDGLRAAMEVVEKKHEVDWFLDKSMPKPGEYDVLLFWSSSTEDYFDELSHYQAKKGIFLTTNPHNINNLRKMDYIFCESDVVYNEVRMHGLRGIKAFGTDTDFFTPDKRIKKTIKYFYPATFSPWKRQSDIAYLGKELLCVGTVQPDGINEYKACKEAGVKIKRGYFPVENIRDYYKKTQNMIIPAVHGSERTVLEAMSMDILPVVLYPNVNSKTYSFLAEYIDGDYKSPRDFVLENYSHKKYAQTVLKAIE